ncbi:hypothetical protein K432DRAFT_380050 [Lepidopterella palustris CBS 459.81]|uniref:Uncharacterized protein n=1 Tax=Lepidopterella palustris CBS 459.81 TaxID=1314670 RepID=A0A8E2JHL0_9PEZI|nr:hypothetical protein K432DRAFT_380050 [Lepidopterella palustris CBS 459.81]
MPQEKQLDAPPFFSRPASPYTFTSPKPQIQRIPGPHFLHPNPQQTLWTPPPKVRFRLHTKPSPIRHGMQILLDASNINKPPDSGGTPK